MTLFETALRALNAMEQSGVVADYAVTGGIAQVFWVEAVPIYDLEVLTSLPQATLHAWASERGYAVRGEHVVIGDIPVQFLASPGPLTDEAMERAATLRFGDTDVRVVRPEYLIAMYLHGSARTRQRRERPAILRDEASIDESLLRDLMNRFALEF